MQGTKVPRGVPQGGRNEECGINPPRMRQSAARFDVVGLGGGHEVPRAPSGSRRKSCDLVQRTERTAVGTPRMRHVMRDSTCGHTEETGLCLVEGLA